MQIENQQNIPETENQFQSLEEFGQFVCEILEILVEEEGGRLPSEEQMNCLSYILPANYEDWLAIEDSYIKFEGFARLSTLISLTISLVWGFPSVDNFFSKQSDYLKECKLEYAHNPWIYLSTIGKILRSAGSQKQSVVSKKRLGMSDFYIAEDNYIAYLTDILKKKDPSLLEAKNARLCVFLLDISSIERDLVNIGQYLPTLLELRNVKSYLVSERYENAKVEMQTLFHIDLDSVVFNNKV